MTTDPSVPRPNVTSPGPRPVSRVVSISSPGAIVGAVLTLVLGICLGIANQGAGGTSMALRVPALLAALLMVGQGIVDLRKNLPRQQQVEVLPEPDSGSRGRELAVVRPLPPRQPVSIVTTRPTPATLSVPIGVMLLAAWLGLADLKEASPQSLTVLSLVAAFALFALGWSLLPARR
jgi:hypothetical protein